MYHYLFTNDLRISTLDESLCMAGLSYISKTVPTAAENKSVNNNMKTLGFYFNITENSVCAKEAAKGNIRAVVFNFIKKFQFPNLRTNECYENCKNDGITLAPMRVIIKVLYTMNVLYGTENAYLTREEITKFIFYNETVAKSKSIDYIQLIGDIKEYRNSGKIPQYVSDNSEEHEWKQEERQLREMVKILKWSGCVSEENERIFISNDSLSQDNKAAIFDIINYQDFWNGSTIEEYRQYMDMSEEDFKIYGEQRYLDKQEKEIVSEEQLALILAEMYKDSDLDGLKGVSIIVFGIKYGKEIFEKNFSVKEIVLKAGLNESYVRELHKGLSIYKCIQENRYGITFGENENNEGIKENHTYIKGENVLFYGVPGSGKSFAIKKMCSDVQLMERVVFHPDYTYSDFVGQILPRLNDFGDLEYVFTPGPFTRILQKAHENKDKMYYLIIEEINRGNAPAIFGEIFQLLDRDSNGTSEYGITNYDIAKEVYGDADELVKIPSNLTILATMNTSDQNVFTLDTAFQRRWKMKHIPNKFNDSHANDMIEGTNVSWGGFATIINGKATDLNSGMPGSGDKRLGAYFAKFDELKKDVFPEKVLRYLWDDVFRMDKEAIFESKYKALEDVFDDYENETEDKLRVVLKSDIYNQMVKTTNMLKEQIRSKEAAEKTEE